MPVLMLEIPLEFCCLAQNDMLPTTTFNLDMFDE